jgi:hypothetical protein
MRGTALALTALVALCLSACSSTAQSAPGSSAAAATSAAATATPTPTATRPLQYEDVLVGSAFTNADICAHYRSTIAHYRSTADKRRAEAGRYAKDPYDAAAYRMHHSWMREQLGDQLAAAVDTAAQTALDTLSGNRAGEVESIDPYRDDSIEACGLTKALTDAATAARKSETAGAHLISQAEARPWYPRGFFEINSELAGRWISGGGDPCGYGPRCLYWTLDVSAHEGCPGGVYVEINMLDGSGTAIDWSNDTLSGLRGGQTGRLQFYTYDLSADTAEITDASCHTF